MHEKRSTQTGPGFEFLAFITREQLGIVSTAIFERVGYFTTPGEGLSVHGIDFIVYKPDGSEPEIALRCRADSLNVVEMHEVSRFWEKITGQHYERGIFVTSKTFSEGALEFAKNRNLILVDANGLKKGIAALPPEQSKEILKVIENRTETPSAKKLKTVSVPDVSLPGTTSKAAATKSRKTSKDGPKVFRTPSVTTRYGDDSAVESEESFVDRELETDSCEFGEPKFAPAESPQSEEEESWTSYEEQASWEAVSNEAGKVGADKSVTTLLAALSPVTLCVAGFMLWEPLMGGGNVSEDERAIVSPVVAKYLDSKENGMGKFELVAEMMTTEQKEEAAEGVVPRPLR